MGSRAAALADRFEKAVEDLVTKVEGCSDAQWRATCGDEKWTVAATAHHVAAQWPLEKEYLDAAIAGRPSPQYTWDDINSLNDRRAAEFANVNKVDVVRLLRDGAPPMASLVRGLSDEQLDRTLSLPLADGAAVSTQQMIEGGILIDHAVAHLRSINGAG